MALHGRLCLTPKTVKGEPRESLTEGGRGRPISQLRGHSRPVWAGVLREIFGFPRAGVANAETHRLTPASPRRPAAIRGRTEGVPEPYRRRPDLVPCRRFGLSQLTVSPGRTGAD
jgi:hypothetical protein